MAAPSGARIRTRLRPTPEEEQALRLMAAHLGGLASRDLAVRVRAGADGLGTRAARKRALTAESSSRWAGAITRTSEDAYQTAMRNLHACAMQRRQAIQTMQRRLAAPIGGCQGRTRGYADGHEHAMKRSRLQRLQSDLARLEKMIAAERPSIVRGGRRPASRLNSDDPTVREHAERQWRASRWFLTADGESGIRWGNLTIRVSPHGAVRIRLPAPLEDLAKPEDRGALTLRERVSFGARGADWLDRVAADRAVRYDISYDPRRGRWYLDASWKTSPAPQPSLHDLAGLRRLAVDTNADHFACWVLDASGNPIGPPHTVALELAGRSAAARDGRLRQAITDLVNVARAHHCAAIAIEDLDFADARATGRERLGRGRRGKRFRRTVAGIPTARLRERLAGMAWHAGLAVIAVDPAYTSRWGVRHWLGPLSERNDQQSAGTATVSRHHAAAVVIGRRSQGLKARRRPGVTGPDRSPHQGGIGTRRATVRNAGAVRPAIQDTGQAARRPGSRTRQDSPGGRGVGPVPPGRPPGPVSRPARTVRAGPSTRTSVAEHRQRPEKESREFQ
ncbi:IS200/IS605 family accessory protein TnpB-related protein [Spirillospora sp. CA-253888]